MAKEKVFIVLTHKNRVAKGSTTKDPKWEVEETVEFVNQVRNRHTSMASVIGDYLNRKMVLGARFGMTDYDKFEEYVRTKYPKQMEELDKAYGSQQVREEETPVFVDQFGNVRTKTVFDV